MDTAPPADMLAIPPELLTEVQADAREEHRNVDAMLLDGVEHFVRERRLQLTLAGRARARALAPTEEDVRLLIPQYHRA